jgi:hypothetical protein
MWGGESNIVVGVFEIEICVLKLLDGIKLSELRMRRENTEKTEITEQTEIL